MNKVTLLPSSGFKKLTMVNPDRKLIDCQTKQRIHNINSIPEPEANA